MEPFQDWRSPQFEEDLSRLDRSGVTFEFLRRNKRYRQDYANTLTDMAAGRTTKEDAIMRLSRRWGLAFPDRPFCIGLDRAPCLAAALLPCHAYCHCCPARHRSFYAS